MDMQRVLAARNTPCPKCGERFDAAKAKGHWAIIGVPPSPRIGKPPFGMALDTMFAQSSQ